VRRYAVVGLLSLVGCATALPPPVALPVPISAVAVETPRPLPVPDVQTEDEPVSTYPVIPTIERAMHRARRNPAPALFSRGTLWYTFEQPSPIYRLDAAFFAFSLIVLAPGEHLYYVDMADTKRWIKDETVMGEGEERRTVVLIKPTGETAKKTSIVVTTSLGMYYLEAFAHQTTYVPAIAWKHAARVVALKSPPPPSTTRYAMRVMTTPAPAWVPTAAWDNGAKTFIRAADALQVTDVPALYVLPADADAEPQLVNYRLKGTLYVIDRLLGPQEAFELRLGDQDAVQAVRVERQEGVSGVP
jgi:type IV secretory pathway VirB9-like protein